MTWAPRNKSEDEDEDEGDASRGKEESPNKTQEGTETLAEDEGEQGSYQSESSGSFLPRRAVVGVDLSTCPAGPGLEKQLKGFVLGPWDLVWRVLPPCLDAGLSLMLPPSGRGAGSWGARF